MEKEEDFVSVESIPSWITVKKKQVFTFDFAIENAWQRSFKRMKRAVAASEGGNETQSIHPPEDEDAEERGREWEIAKLQHEIRQAQYDFHNAKEENDEQSKHTGEETKKSATMRDARLGSAESMQSSSKQNA